MGNTRGAQGYTSFNRGAHRFIGVYESLQAYTMVSRVIQAFKEVYIGIKGCKGI